MTTVALKGLWTFIESMSLSDKNKQWLADRLIESKKKSRKEAQEQYVRESLTRAFRETKEMQASGQRLPDANNLFEEIDD